MISFKPDGTTRPWPTLSTSEGRPFRGDQYVAITLTVEPWMDAQSSDSNYWKRLRSDLVDIRVAQPRSEITR